MNVTSDTLLQIESGFLVDPAPGEMHCWQNTQPTITLLSRHKVKRPNTTLTSGTVQSPSNPTFLQVQQSPATTHMLSTSDVCMSFVLFGDVCIDWGCNAAQCSKQCVWGAFWHVTLHGIIIIIIQRTTVWAFTNTTFWETDQLLIFITLNSVQSKSTTANHYDTTTSNNYWLTLLQIVSFYRYKQTDMQNHHN
jgi:hypothetical protein